MRIRSVKPEFFTDRVTGRFPLELQMFYVALWCWADDSGRFEWEPDLIRCQLFPFHPDLDAAGLLDDLVERGRLIRYEADGVKYGAIPSFERHQHPDKKKSSTIPAPLHGGATAPRPVPDPSPTPPRPITAVGEGRGEEGRGGATAPRPLSSDVLGVFRRRLGEALCVVSANPLRVAKPERAAAIRADVVRLGLDAAVEACADHARECGKVPSVLDWFADFLAELPTPAPVRAPDECPKWTDPDFDDPAAWPTQGQFFKRDLPPDEKARRGIPA